MTDQVTDRLGEVHTKEDFIANAPEGLSEGQLESAWKDFVVWIRVGNLMVDKAKRGELQNIQFMSLALVERCPYCGTKNWDEPKKKPNGELCHHQTKLRKIR
jgi:hypothetical protein